MGTVSNGVLTARITDSMVRHTISTASNLGGGRAIEFNIITSANAPAYHSIRVSFDRAAINSLNSRTHNVYSVRIGTNVIDLNLDRAAIGAVVSQTSGNVTVSAARETRLSVSARTLIGSRPVFYVAIIGTGRDAANVTDLRGGTVTMGIAYTPSANEDTGNLFGVHVDASGSPHILTDSGYTDGRVIIGINSLSLYGVGYQAHVPAFADTE